MKVSWQVTGIRNDAYARKHRIQVEIPKEEQERGKYLFPDEHNVPESMGIHYEEHQKLIELQKEMKTDLPKVQAGRRDNLNEPIEH
ncbi:MAG TPA: hypothetical protein ENN90_11160 [Mariniphaga anaerophila]|uniref:Uncharacterized protein n=1 Tax=Mariniphaga anaerophila TaxID=1484053 RepID=A0A831LSM6_9BACT|nr:hypothetical protein [Mariniphaga anaerophila]